jgi:hypothetical protein
VTQNVDKGRTATHKHTVVLDVVPAVSHKAADMMTQLLRTLTDYALMLKDILCIVCDNASANTLMVQQLNRQLADDGSSHRLFISYCMCHSIHRAIVMVLAAAHHILHPVRRIVFQIHYSTELTQNLSRRVQQADHLARKSPLRATRVICDVPTRWNSMSDMLERVVSLRPEISALLAEYENRLPQLSATHWAVIGTEHLSMHICHHLPILDRVEEFSAFLKKVKKYTTDLSADSKPTLSVVIPLYNKIINIFEDVRSDCILLIVCD